MSHESERKRVKISTEELDKLSKEEIIRNWLLQEEYISGLEVIKPSESEAIKECEERLKQHQNDASRRESVLVMRLTQKEHEMQEYLAQIQDLKQNQVPSSTQLKTTLVDPAVNFLFDKMQKELESTRTKLEETQNELSAWKFTPDSNNGKRLLMKCRMLYQENEELGKMVAIGRIAKIEGDLALQKQFSEEMKLSQQELEDFIYQLEEDEEGLQGTIYLLQQQLREANQQISQLKQDNQDLQNQLNKYLQNGPSLLEPTVKPSHPVTVKDEFRTDKPSSHHSNSSESKGKGRTKSLKNTIKLEDKNNNGSVTDTVNSNNNSRATIVVLKSSDTATITSTTKTSSHSSSRSNKRRSPCQSRTIIDLEDCSPPPQPPPNKKFHAAASLKDAAANVTDPEAIAAATLASLWAGNHVTNGSEG